MALRFFWTCESTTLSTGVDYSVGDTTATASGAPAISATGAKVGTNGISTTDGLDYYTFSTSGTAIALPGEGAIGLWIQYPSSVPGAGYDYGVIVKGSNASDYISIQTATSGNFRIRLSNSTGPTTDTITTASVNAQAGTWYFVVVRWDFANTKARAEVYTGSSTTVEGTAGEDLALTAAAQPADLSGSMQIGNNSSQLNVVYIDNVFVSDDYDEPLHLYGNRDITDIDDYQAGSADLKLQVYADATKIYMTWET